MKFRWPFRKVRVCGDCKYLESHMFSVILGDAVKADLEDERVLRPVDRMTLCAVVCADCDTEWKKKLSSMSAEEAFFSGAPHCIDCGKMKSKKPTDRACKKFGGMKK